MQLSQQANNYKSEDGKYNGETISSVSVPCFISTWYFYFCKKWKYLSLEDDSRVIVWCGHADKRSYSIIDLNTTRIYREKELPGPRVLCATYCDNTLWLGTEVSIFAGGCEITPIMIK